MKNEAVCACIGVAVGFKSQVQMSRVRVLCSITFKISVIKLKNNEAGFIVWMHIDKYMFFDPH